MAPTKFREKRLTKRFSCLTPHYGNFRLDSEERGLALFQNVSEDGLMLKAYRPLIPGQELELNIQRHDSAAFSVSGMVRWCEKDGDFWAAGVALYRDSVLPEFVYG